jgi:dsDNA-specific endonuclease/ATPase MutS2
MPFATGAQVVVLTLGRKRGVVVETGRGGRYRVLVDNAMISCREDDLMAALEQPGRTRRARQREHKAPARDAAEPVPPGRVDLHGLTVEDALARVVEQIDRALRRGADRIEVVHGKGAGRIRDALHRQLPTLPVVKAFRLDPANPGVTWIFL